MVGHAGSGPGFSNMVARFPEDDLTIVVLSNSDEASGGGVTKSAREVVGIRSCLIPEAAAVPRITWVEA